MKRRPTPPPPAPDDRPSPPALRELIELNPGDVLVLHDATCAEVAADLTGPTVTLVRVGDPLPEPARWAAALLLVGDVAVLRHVASVLPRLGRSKVVGCWLADTDRPLVIAPRAEWPTVTGSHARILPAGGALTVVRTARRVAIRSVLEEFARQAVPADSGSAGLVVATTVPDPLQAPPADPGLLVLDSVAGAADPTLDVPPDVVLAGDVSGAPHVVAHHVTGRPATVVGAPAAGHLPVDEGVFNPRGFQAEPELGEVVLSAGTDGLSLEGMSLSDQPIALTRGITPTLLPPLREHRGVRVRSGAAVPPELAHAIATLACTGVPLVVEPAVLDPSVGLGERLRDALGRDVDLADPLAREEHSIRVRRAALLEHSMLAMRSQWAAAAGLPWRAFPSVSIVLATKRPEQLEFALRQVARQRGVDDLELVLVAHGFSPDAAMVRELAGCPTVVLTRPAEELFGAVLNAGVGAAGGDLVTKMDDDDWYGPDHLADLLLARHYSGADVTGSTFEFSYLHETDQTIQRQRFTECHIRYVAGGSMLLTRAWLRELGGFRHAHRFVDTSLLAQVAAAGGDVYRTHGLGYVLRRQASGHTWTGGTEYLMDPDRIRDTWSGFRPSSILEVDPRDLPVTP